MDKVYDAIVEHVSVWVAKAMLDGLATGPEAALTLDVSVKELLRRVGRNVVEQLYRDLGAQVVEEARGRGHCVNRSAEIDVSCLFGEVRVASPYMRNRSTGETTRPVKERMGLTHRCKTPGVERALTDFGIEDSFGLAAQRFEEHYGWEVGRTSVLRVVHDLAAEAVEFIGERLSAEVGEISQPWGILVEMDGCELRTGTLEETNTGEVTPIRGQPRRKRVEQWRDVRLAFARALDRDSKTFVGGMSPYSEVVDQLHDAARLEGMTPHTVVVAVVDGGVGLREAIEAKFGEVICVLDRPHLSEHLHDVAKEMGKSDCDRFAWVSEVLGRLHDGGVASVLAELTEYDGPGNSRVDRFLKHLWRFQDAVDYGHFHHFGIPQGSGEIESAHRYVPQRRLKMAGACWHPDSINPILALRILRANGWWQEFWAHRPTPVQAAA